MCESKGSLLFLPVLYAIPEECPHRPSVAGVLSGSVWSLLASVCVCVCVCVHVPLLPPSSSSLSSALALVFAGVNVVSWPSTRIFGNVWKCLEDILSVLSVARFDKQNGPCGLLCLTPTQTGRRWRLESTFSSV